MKRTSLGALAALLSLTTPHIAAANSCATASRDGAQTISTATVVNTYYPGTSTAVNAGATTLTVGAANGTTPIAAGDLLLIVQVQGATINTSNTTAYGGSLGNGSVAGSGYTGLSVAGHYEYVRAGNAVGLTGGTLSVVGGTLTNYATGAASGTLPRRRFQVIRVPEYRSLNLSGQLSAPAWNGSTGGIVVVDVAGTLTLSGGGANVSGRGFRGGGGYTSLGSANAVATDYSSVLGTGTANAAGAKGEGIVGTPIKTFDGTTVTIGTAEDVMGLRSGARGAPGNAGGGGTDGNPANSEQNTGGGGGGGGGAGGQGGYAWCNTYGQGNCAQSGGVGGVGIPDGGTGSLILGGGGGAGVTNNSTGTLANGGSSSGAPGGGAILIRAGTITGSGTFSADGGTFTSNVTNDGSGGGGAGGTIQIIAGSSSASIIASAVGGNGMSNTGGNQSHGPGGGGGGGAIVSTIPLSTRVNGGANGTTDGGNPYGVAYGAAPGQSGIVNTSWSSSSVPGFSAGYECTPDVAKAFVSSSIPVNGVSRLTVTVTNPNPTIAMNAASFTDALPSGTLIAPTPNAATTCTNATLSATAGATSFAMSGGTVAAGSSCTASVNVTSSATGTYVNTIPIGGASGNWNAGSTTNVTNTSTDPASATLTVTPGLTISKQAAVLYDPVNGVSANAKAIPGAFVQYSLTVTNPANVSVDADTVIMGDVLPANVSLIVSSLYQQQNYPNARGPFQYIDGQRADGSTGTASGLGFTFTSLSSTTDSADFSNDGTTFTYTPTPAANFTDATVKAVRFRMFGTMAPNSSFTLNFLVRVN